MVPVSASNTYHYSNDTTAYSGFIRIKVSNHFNDNIYLYPTACTGLCNHARCNQRYFTTSSSAQISLAGSNQRKLSTLLGKVVASPTHFLPERTLSRWKFLTKLRWLGLDVRLVPLVFPLPKSAKTTRPTWTTSWRLVLLHARAVRA